MLPEQRGQIDLIQSMNRDLLEAHPENSELEGVIQASCLSSLSRSGAMSWNAPLVSPLLAR